MLVAICESQRAAPAASPRATPGPSVPWVCSPTAWPFFEADLCGVVPVHRGEMCLPGGGIPQFAVTHSCGEGRAVWWQLRCVMELGSLCLGKSPLQWDREQRLVMQISVCCALGSALKG